MQPALHQAFKTQRIRRIEHQVVAKCTIETMSTNGFVIQPILLTKEALLPMILIRYPCQRAKPNKKVLILSSMHSSVEIEKNNIRISETIGFYNSTKFDQMARKYSVKPKFQRWPLQVFLNTLDLAGINAWILYKETTGEEISRQEFLFQLAEELGTVSHKMLSTCIILKCKHIILMNFTIYVPRQLKANIIKYEEYTGFVDSEQCVNSDGKA
uniref:PiggyBac transposable element-derived protein domain-containing protein n=1 Tax=Glossina austeni TaxID=7395 RepID=A0A1A9VHW1_GLOAU